MRNAILIAAIAGLSVLSISAAAEETVPIEIKIHNNTKYNFTGGYVSNRKHISVSGLPVTINAGDKANFTANVSVESTDHHLDVHWTLSGDDGKSVAIKYKMTGTNDAQCHTDVPDGIHSDHYECKSGKPEYYFCESSSKSDCDN